MHGYKIIDVLNNKHYLRAHFLSSMIDFCSFNHFLWYQNGENLQLWAFDDAEFEFDIKICLLQWENGQMNDLRLYAN